MHHDITMLLVAAIPVGVIHTVMGPDHYVPFIALAKARNWRLDKTMWITTICGIGHVLSAAVLGVLGIACGLALTKFSFIETWRGEIAAWLLISFGLLYFVWGVRGAIRHKKHGSHHHHLLGMHHHDHINHSHAHSHHHHARKELTPWILFIIFVLGPCEPLIPLMMYPAIKGVLLYVILISLIFGLATVATMLLAVYGSLYGMRFLKKFSFWEKYGSATAGAIICGAGLGIKFLG